MRLLLDTHAFLWFVMGDSRLSATARSLIEDEQNDKLLSAASLWEMAIKVSIGKLTLAEPFAGLVPREIKANGIVLLPIELDHASVLATLPFHHRDPFDRTIIAQGITEKIPIVSSDPAFDAYPVTRLW